MSAPHFNLIGRLTRLLHTTDGTAPGSGWGSGALAGYDYVYDAASRLTEIDSFVDGLTEYTHDNTSQLTAADHTGQTDENYTYDANGNRTGGGYVTGDNNQTTEDGVYTYTYDAEGNRLTRTRVSDGYVTAYEWDHRNRLASVTERDDMETVLAVTEHDYDAFNQWIRRTVDADGPGSGDPVETIFAHHDGQIVYQFDGDTAADLTNRYLWNPSAVDHLLVDEVVASLSTAGDLQFPLGDHLGTIRDIAEYDAGTDTTTIANHIRYNSFGQVISQTNSAIDLLFAFTSRPLDESTGLQNNLHRWYDAALGQWLSEDPIGFNGGTRSLRNYGYNDPISETDPNGLIPPNPSIIINQELENFGNNFFTDWWHFANPFSTQADVNSRDALDVTLRAGTRIGQGMAVIGTAGAGIAYSTGMTAGAMATAAATEVFDTVVEEALSAAAGVPVIIPMSPADILQDGAKVLFKRGAKECAENALEQAAENAAKNAPIGSGSQLSVPQTVYTSTDVPVDLTRARGTFVTEIDIT